MLVPLFKQKKLGLFKQNTNDFWSVVLKKFFKDRQKIA